ncbi:MAG: ATP-binding protein [Deltaproteobacteria bacterium]
MINKLYLPGDNEQIKDLKKNFFIFSINGIVPVAILTLICYIWDLPVLMQYGLLLLAYYLINFPYFLYSKKLYRRYFYIGQIYTLIITLITIARLGGILYSAGLIYSCLTVSLFTFTFPEKKLAIITSVMSLTGIIVLTIGQPWLTIAPEMLHPYKNLVFTTVNAVWQTVYILSIVLNIFEKRNQEVFEKNQKLHELDQLKTKLFSNISHEFRTPLTLIKGAATLPYQEIKSSNSNIEINERLNLISSNSTRLLRLVNQMLDLSKLETGNLHVRYIQTDVVPVISYLVESRRSVAEQKKISLQFISALDHLIMDIDFEKMEDILLNLLHNAIKFTPDGGNVIISLISGENNRQNVHIKVKDTGIGIAEENLEKIFDRFYQVDQDSPEGSGIGLTLTKEYVQLLGGELSIQSELNKGSTFSVNLPIKNEAQLIPFEELFKTNISESFDQTLSVDLLKRTQNEDVENSPLILIVEDNKELAYFLQTMLLPFYRIETAFDGQEGVQKAFEIIPDLIISDVMMPVMDGFELCDQLKNDFKTNHIPIILLTAKVDAESKLTGLKKGADDYLAKPFNADELLVRIKNLIEIREKLKQKFSRFQSGELIENEVYTGLDKLFMDELNKLLGKHYTDEDFGIEEACKGMKISRIQLHRKLVALSGMSASHFINQFRVDKAAKLLLSTRKTVSEIAFEVGFHDANYFSRIFTKIYSVSPGDYRKQKQ